MNPKEQELVHAFLDIADRRVSNGDHWCIPRHVTVVQRWLYGRSKDLGGALRQLVRLVRILSRVDGGRYGLAQYARLPVLRTEVFRRVLTAESERNALFGIAEINWKTKRTAGGQIKREAIGIVLTEPAMGVGTRRFDLRFGQMPRLVALLDVIVNLLPYCSVNELLKGLLGPTVSDTADEFARRLAAALNAKISDCLDSNHRLRQAQAIREFLISTKRLKPDDIDDVAVLDIWIHLSRSEEVEGFRLFRSAARHTLRYRDSLALKTTEHEICGALGLSDGDPEAMGVDLDRYASSIINPADWMSPAEVPSALSQELSYWDSPLKSLLNDPARRVKWLFEKDYKFLAGIYEGLTSDDERTKALFGTSHFNPRFTRTLIRCCHFSGVQNQLVECMRKRTAYASPPIEAAQFNLVRARFEELASRTEKALGAAACILMQAGRRQGLNLAHAFLGDHFAVLLKSMMASAAREVCADEDELMEIALSKLASSKEPSVQLMYEAYAHVERAGFREEDAGNADYIEALVAGSQAVEDLHIELTKISDALGQLDLDTAYQEDAAIFHTHFAKMYCDEAYLLLTPYDPKQES